jgi:hypothetical protein
LYTLRHTLRPSPIPRCTSRARAHGAYVAMRCLARLSFPDFPASGVSRPSPRPSSQLSALSRLRPGPCRGPACPARDDLGVRRRRDRAPRRRMGPHQRIPHRRYPPSGCGFPTLRRSCGIGLWPLSLRRLSPVPMLFGCYPQHPPMREQGTWVVLMPASEAGTPGESRPVRAPLSGVQVDPIPAAARMAGYEVQTGLFSCFENCRQRFRRDPHRYTAQASRRSGGVPPARESCRDDPLACCATQPT